MRISLEQAADLIAKGHVVAIPTETVYGLAASLKHPEAIAKIFSLKGRPSNNPLIVHIADASQVISFVEELPPHFHALAEAFWPGPLTLVMDVLVDQIPTTARAGLTTAAFRIPAHPLTRELIRKIGPLVMPSANLSGKPSATDAEHVEKDFGKEFPILDGGKCTKGVESTIIDFDGETWKILRLGALEPEAFIPLLGYCPVVEKVGEKEKRPRCPGQLYRHYAPHAHLHLVTEIPKDLSGVLIGFDNRSYPTSARVISLGMSNDPLTAAQRLYAALRQLDDEEIKEAWVDMNLPDEGLWLTVKERLHRASKR